MQSGVTTVTKFALDGWNPAKGAPVGNENWDILADLDASGSLTTRYLRGDIVDQVFGAPGQHPLGGPVRKETPAPAE